MEQVIFCISFQNRDQYQSFSILPFKILNVCYRVLKLPQHFLKSASTSTSLMNGIQVKDIWNNMLRSVCPTKSRQQDAKGVFNTPKMSFQDRQQAEVKVHASTIRKSTSCWCVWGGNLWSLCWNNVFLDRNGMIWTTERRTCWEYT